MLTSIYCIPFVSFPRLLRWSDVLSGWRGGFGSRRVWAWRFLRQARLRLGFNVPSLALFLSPPFPPFALPLFPFPFYFRIFWLISKARLRTSDAISSHCIDCSSHGRCFLSYFKVRFIQWVTQLLASQPLRIFRFQFSIQSCTELP